MKQIPNLFTLLNLIFGCVAIVLTLQTGEGIVMLDNVGAINVVLPEKIMLASYFIFAAALIDFLDGFLARLLKAPSEMGKQLDSLSDVVSFGVAPAMILYQFLRMSYAQEENGLDVPVLALVPAFLFAAAAAWRLAKFNISTNQTDSFRGLPTPAAGLTIASFPLIFWYQDFFRATLINAWFLYAVIVLISLLMVSNLRLMALKFKDYSFGNNVWKYVLLIASIVCFVVLHWLAIPVILLLYVVLSQLEKRKAFEPRGTAA